MGLITGYRGVSLGSVIPEGGSTGQVLTKATNADYDVAWQAGGGGGGAPTNATYVTLTNNGSLTDNRTLAVANGLTLTDSGATGNIIIGVSAVPIANIDNSIILMVQVFS